MKHINIIIWVLALSSLSVSCKKNKGMDEAIKIVTKWTGKDKVDFLFFFQPKDEKELTTLFKQYAFRYPVFLDRENKLERLKPEQKKVRTNAFDEKPVQDTGKMKIKEMYARTYIIENNGYSPFVIMDVDMSSISCTDPLREKRPPCVRREGFDKGITKVKNRRSVQGNDYGIWELGECLVTINGNGGSKMEKSRLTGVNEVLTTCIKRLLCQNREMEAPDIWKLGDNDFEMSRLC
jgi:hypothetical protein